jgi:hypothetical protein
MARHLDCDCKYSVWNSQWDWAKISGRSTTKWGSATNMNGTTVYNSSDNRLGYSPSAGEVDEMACKFLMAKVRAVLGYRAIILTAPFRMVQVGASGSSTCTMRVAKFLKPYPDINQISYLYKDVGSVTPWFNSGYAAQFGHDISSTPIATALYDKSIAQYTYYPPIDIKTYLQEQLLRNDDLWLSIWQQDTATFFFVSGPNHASYPWDLDIYYLFPIEMFPALGDGTIDLTRLLNVDNEPLDLGAYQRLQTGAAVKFMLKNFSSATIAHVEVWDDHPQWSDPQPDAANTGSGDLAYASVYEACCSQRWEVKFSSASAFEVKATAYLDNVTSLHPAYDATPAWQGTTGGDWSDPSGNVTIPSAAWSGTPATNDLFVFYTRGQTTDAAWPEDSNDQVEICSDNGGAPLADWRPVNGRRTESTSSVTIDATTKTVNVQRIVTADWPIGGEVFVANQDTINPGTIKSVTATTVEIENLTADSNVYAAGAIVATTLPLRDIAASQWGQLSADSGPGQTYKDRVYVANADQIFTATGVPVFVQSVMDPDTSEAAMILAVTGTYIQLTGDLTNNYEAGDMVARTGQGEAAFWLRVVASGSTDEELKEFRLNVIA